MDQIQVTSAQELDHVLVTVPQPPSDKVRMDDTLKLDITGLGIPSFPRARQQVVFKGTEHTDACSGAHGTHGTNTDSHPTAHADCAERQTERREHGSRSGMPSFVCARQQNAFIGIAHTDASSRAHGTHRTNTDSHGQTAWIVRCGTSKLKVKRETERREHA